MRRLAALFLSLLVSSHYGLQAQFAAKTLQQAQDAVSIVNNGDVLKLVKAGVATEIIVAKLDRSECTCDISTTELRRLKSEGVADEVLLAMIRASKSSARTELRPVKIPKNTIIEIEAAYRISSQEIRTGDPISFRVIAPVRIDAVTVIESGSTATAKVVQASRGGHFGRAGRLAWVMQNVIAVDGTKVPIQSAGRLVGDSKGATVATQIAITGVLLWPIAPVALLHGFKRGKNAYLAQGRRYETVVSVDTTVNAR